MKVVTAPNNWKCGKCGGEIKANEQCGKEGKKILCARCIQKGKTRT